MPFYNIESLRIVLADYKFRDTVWPIMSQKYLNQYGNKVITDKESIDIRLKFCFKILIEIFEEKFTKVANASFFTFVHVLNENLTHLFFKQLQGLEINHKDFTEYDLALERRIYKIILERFVGCHLYHSDPIDVEILKNKEKYLNELEELLYIGSQIYLLSDFIAQNSLIPKSLKISPEDGQFTVLMTPFFNTMLDKVKLDMFRHNKNVVIIDIVREFADLLSTSMDIKYGEALSMINLQDEDPDYLFGYMNLEKVIDTLVDELGNSKEGLIDFYAGLTLSNDNLLSIEDSILRSQKNERYLYRPILKLRINDQIVYKLGKHKLHESISTLTSNGLPYGKCPIEWTKHKKIRKYIGKLQNEHDKVLESPACELISQRGYIFDRSIKSLKTSNPSQNENIERKGLGEIDIIFCMNVQGTDTIFVCECKNNRLRSDLYNWKRDYSNFEKSYEKQLSQKVNWVSNNISKILLHLEKISKTSFLNRSDNKWQVEGIFIINAPTFYMYDGTFRVFTLTSFSELLRNQYEDKKYPLEDTETGRKMIVEYPYFKNLIVNYG